MIEIILIINENKSTQFQDSLLTIAEIQWKSVQYTVFLNYAGF